MERLQQFISELKRRRVFRALVVWGIVAFAVLQVYEPLMHGLHLPEWTLSFVVLVLGLGFPVTAALAWVFDIKAGGIERTPPTEADGEGSPAASRARLALLILGVGVAAASPGLVYYFVLPSGTRRARGETPVAPTAPTGVAAAAPGPSIAVLPFADMSPQHDQEYFADGVAEEILNALAQVEGLRVPGRTSSFWFKGKNFELAEVGQKLNVTHVLEGSVRRAGNRLRVTAQVVSVADGYHLWSETFDRDQADIFAVQDQVARAVVEAMRGRLLPEDGKARSTRPVSPEAYDHYLQGRQALRAGTLASYRRAIAEFETALALAPSYPSAWAGLGEAAIWAWGLAEEPVPELATRAIAAADQSIALAPDLPDGYRVRGVVRRDHDRDWAGAKADLERAVALGPSDPEASAQLAWLLGNLGQSRESIGHARRATALDPLSASAWVVLGSFLTASGDLDEGYAAAARAIAISEDNPVAALVIASNRLLAGQPQAALSFTDRSSVGWVRLTGSAMANHNLGRARESNAALSELVARFGPVAAYQVAQVLAWRGETDRAFEWLDRAVAQRDPGLTFLKADPILRKLRVDPRFAGLLRKMNLPLD